MNEVIKYGRLTITFRENEENAQADARCPFCGQQSTLMVNKNEVREWLNGKLAQKAFRTLTPINREFLISGICRDCQEKVFAD